MGVRFEKTSKGELAILPRTEYEALVAKAAEADEDAGTVRLVARAKKQAAEPLIPKHVVDRLASGENPVRVFREWKDITQMHLSFKTAISQGHLSDIESGRRVGTADALRRIVDALDVPLDLLA